MSVEHDKLAALTAAIFRHAGSSDDEADTIARHLVEANLVGHDSHGVIRVPAYVQWVQDGKLVPNQKISVVFENDSMAVLDGNFGFGQSIGEQAVDYGIEKCRKSGLSLVGLRNAGHVGRVGDWAIRAAAQGLVSLHFVNTSGGGILVAPFGGIERRLSANPIAAGIPVAGGEPIIADLSTCVIAEGKIRVARNKGVPVPDNAILDGEGNPTTDPEAFYADPPGAILTIGAHKGYVLSVLCEVMAGAITGSGCSNPNNPTA
ncbi:MAG: Ldh family oxidoreductase, partial [Alphaproteobacteria bacterium]|nr:Ldh family oxidoreductase [Alphaproteobacteria bacterium]